MDIARSYRKIREELPDHVTLVLACKGHSTPEILQAIEAGATELGHNYVQEAGRLIQSLGERAAAVRWHLIGELQTNKINKALQLFDLIQTVNSLARAQHIEQRAARLGRVVPILVEINVAREPAKSGFPPDAESLEALARSIAGMEHLALRGLMTMGPASGDPRESRPYFARTRALLDHLKSLELPSTSPDILSMGMSDTYQVAVEEGATMVRLGTLIFGPPSCAIARA
ncbi:MAG: YggS family pyridoxal phosphate-dependent enzyme [Bradymonadales bacterium]|nr:YggS family pyridoxal phosphate-dependent enzyme [Bradymonadales bacterium]